jgi:hypothetical protein
MQHARVESACQGHRRDRHTRLLTCAYRFSLEKRTVDSTPTTAGLDQLSVSIHVNAYLLG